MSNLLEYMMQHTHNKEMKLKVTTQSSLKEGQQLHFTLTTQLKIDDVETLFDSYYDEGSRRYVGLGLFVAKELTHLMDGSLEVFNSEEGYQYFRLVLPIEEKNREKRKYRLPDKGLVGKKILIVDKSEDAAQATEKLFAYFRADVTVLTAQNFGENMPNFALYDIVALNDTLFNFKILELTLRTFNKP
ncbi:MAG: sensor histidine kinase [Epsilonproteobacteria bacterium]|nr:sensor histidine kinase [Campylobacterota bacterium]